MIVLALELCGCGEHKCQESPPFYLKGTDFDCKAREPTEPAPQPTTAAPSVDA
jgi:hypothetical protein